MAHSSDSARAQQAPTRIPASWYNARCKKCSRLNDYLKEIKRDFPNYSCKPVTPFGDINARLLIVGLAPGKHGANATGRPFTGDYAGVLLYQTLHRFGFASKPESVASDDDLELIDCRITNAVKCLPPENKPTTDEVNTCLKYLSAEVSEMKNGLIISLGGIAHRAVLKVLGQKLSKFPFGHGAEYEINDHTLLASYHCSRYNTQTRRLSTTMFEDIFKRARQISDGKD